MFFVIGFANAVNLTDGLDGLAAGLVALAAVGLAVIGWAGLQPSAAVLGCAVAASAAAFLRLNGHPARVFMGDVGSNALGAVLAALAIITKSEVALMVLGASLSPRRSQSSCRYVFQELRRPPVSHESSAPSL
jgi:phospho-N-acetylmuramoyl-pentapeptide-transferase